MGEQQFGNGPKTVGCCHQQRRGTGTRLRVYIRAVRQQDLGHAPETVPRRQVQGRLAIIIGGLNVRFVAQQQLHHRLVPATGCHVQGGLVRVILRVHLRTVGEEELGHDQLSTVCRRVQGRIGAAGSILGVNQIGAVLDHRLNALDILRFAGGSRGCGGAAGSFLLRRRRSDLGLQGFGCFLRHEPFDVQAAQNCLDLGINLFVDRFRQRDSFDDLGMLWTIVLLESRHALLRLRELLHQGSQNRVGKTLLDRDAEFLLGETFQLRHLSFQSQALGCRRRGGTGTSVGRENRQRLSGVEGGQLPLQI